MGLNLGICREEEKAAKKGALLNYLRLHLKVRINHLELFDWNSEQIVNENDSTFELSRAMCVANVRVISTIYQHGEPVCRQY